MTYLPPINASQRKLHHIRFGILTSALWFLLLCATWMASTPSATAQVNFAFSVGDGVNAYYLPNASNFVYAYDGYYYDWAGNRWFYGIDGYGPWYPLPLSSVLPLPLEYGPPPPAYPYQPYFLWWRARVAPWYQVNHPGWWFRHRADMTHYRIWRSRAIPRYRGRPFYRGPMHPVFHPAVPGHRFARPFLMQRMRGPVAYPSFRPRVRHGFRPRVRPGFRRPVMRPMRSPIAPQRVRPIIRSPMVRPASRPINRRPPARPMNKGQNHRVSR